MIRTLALVVSATFCAAAAHRPLTAQAAGDTTGLAQAAALAITDSALVRLGETVLWEHSGTPLDSAVARIVTRTSRVGAPVADSTFAVWIGLGRELVGTDTATLIVETHQQYARTGTFTFWTEQNAYDFQRVARGWRFVRKRFLRHGDGGPVRGRR
jgi:hypothetical protein